MRLPSRETRGVPPDRLGWEDGGQANQGGPGDQSTQTAGGQADQTNQAAGGHGVQSGSSVAAASLGSPTRLSRQFRPPFTPASFPVVSPARLLLSPATTPPTIPGPPSPPLRLPGSPLLRLHVPGLVRPPGLTPSPA